MRSLIVLLVAALLAPLPAAAESIARVGIDEVEAQDGLAAWLVAEPSVPIVVVEAAFPRGSARDPQGKEGLALMTAALLDEGAGPYDSEAFRTLLEDNSIELSFSADRDALYVSLTTLAPNLDLAVELLTLALTDPRFDKEPVERIRNQLLVRLARAEEDPRQVASRTFYATIFEGHPYARPSDGTPDSIKAIKRADIDAFRKEALTRAGLKIAIVGDIDAARAAALLEASFGKLPEGTRPPALPEAALQNLGEVKVVTRDNPQTVLLLGAPGLERRDPDFVPAYVMNYVLGGGGFASRLMEEVREKRGLAYSVSSGLLALKAAGLLQAGAGTENASAARSLDLIRAELSRMGQAGVSADELKAAKLYLTGSFPLRFDSNAKIARELLDIQLDELGIDYINERNGLIEAVTTDDIARVAKRLLGEGSYLVVAVGAPEGLAPSP
ncbi:MAG: insulinase family protein [Alphaproteobacteria bacterium]|nr:insulinase family protein [Alphaproteobacteria bacterium]